MDVVSAKRIKFNDSSTEDVLNLSLTAREPQPNLEDVANDLTEMRKRFQQWVIEMYRDSSKTKTITTKKYERIVKTLAGEIKNCAENSKFRFWMKCKGFKLEAQPGGVGQKLLLVQDRKGEEIKYKKVAVVENFFDIIYNVHVNEGARGVQHAGQKRTHRTITETYAFLPREAVTRFLLCCSECQKRTHDERKISPNSSSCDSTHGHETCNLPQPTIAIENSQPLNFSSSYTDCPCDDFKPVTSRTDYDNNNCVDQAFDKPYNFCTKQITSILDPSDMTRKRKRKFTRKIVRPVVEPQEVDFADRRVTHGEDAVPLKSTDMSLPGTDLALDYRDHSSRFKTESIQDEPCLTNTHGCPYLSKLSEVLYDPAKYAEDNERTHPASLDEEFLEQLAVNLIAKARRMEAAKSVLTEHQRQQLSLKVYSCRISSFLLNYAADLMLKTVITE